MTKTHVEHRESLLKLAGRYEKDAIGCLMRGHAGVVGLEEYLVQAATRFTIARGLREAVNTVDDLGLDLEKGADQ